MSDRAVGDDGSDSAETPAADDPPALIYIEKTLADSYRKEVDQEENVWRSLPFFAATLALQLAALFQIIDKLPDPTTSLGLLSLGCLTAAGALTLVSLGFLAATIYPQRFEYIAKEPALLNYAWELIDKERALENEGGKPRSMALVTLRTQVARQYALATDHNRRINDRRERWRSVAGLAALGSVLMTVFLVSAAYAHYLSIRVEKDHGDETPRASTAGSIGDRPKAQVSTPFDAGPPPDAGRH